jgi:CelD/BcsL family acetyltransferase involved in cellulose biosynthesis
VILPLCVERRGPLRLLRFIGHGPGDELGPVCAPEDYDDAVSALRAALDRGGWNVFAGEQLPANASWQRLGAREVSHEASPVLRFEQHDWDEYLRTRSSNFRSTLRRNERKLADRASFRLADVTTLEADFDALLALHSERWGNATTAFNRHEAFHREFVRIAFERGWARLWTLEIDGERAAVWYGFRFAAVESYYQAGRAARYEKVSAGLALLAHTVRAAQADGMDEYRFLRGDEPFKKRFTDDDPGLVTIARTRGALGGAALAAALGARRVRKAAATLLRRSPRTAPPAAAGRPAE